MDIIFELLKVIVYTVTSLFPAMLGAAFDISDAFNSFKESVVANIFGISVTVVVVVTAIFGIIRLVLKIKSKTE